MNILVPLDGSQLAERAVQPAAAIARRPQASATITLVRVVDFPIVAGGLESLSPVGPPPQIFDAEISAARAYLGEIATWQVLAGLDVRLEVVTGQPSQAIAFLTGERSIDLIVMTTHGRSGLSYLALGSVAEQVAQTAGVPVLMVRPDGETIPDVGRHEAFTILVPLDGHELAEAAIRPAADLARLMLGTIYLLRVLPEPQAEGSGTISASEAYAYLTAWHDWLTSEGVNVHRCLAFGDPATQIVAKAHEHHADLIAIATHGRHGLDRIREGSVTADVIRRTKLPLLVLHEIPVHA